VKRVVGFSINGIVSELRPTPGVRRSRVALRALPPRRF
jgi:hypothetical protein